MSALTKEQERASHALEKINELKDYGNFVSYANSLPASIVMNGLGQAMAFELSSGKKDIGHKELYRIMQDWLCGKSGVFTDEPDLMIAITKKPQREYIRAQAEALAYLDWLKKFSRAYLKGDNNG